MTGKILGQGAIRGEDGVRYYYDDGAIKNPQDAQNINGCEVDFEIENGKAVDIFIIKSGKSVESNGITNQSTDDLTNDSNEVISKAFAGGFIFKGRVFKGRVSNCINEALSNVSGSIRVSSINTGFYGNVSGGGGGGKISTTHHHARYFNIGNKSFEWNGKKPIDNGDEVVLFAVSMSNGYHNVKCLRNLTKGLSFMINGGTLGDCIVGTLLTIVSMFYCVKNYADTDTDADTALVVMLVFIFLTLIFSCATLSAIRARKINKAVKNY